MAGEPAVEIREPETSSEWEAYFGLRNRVLRQPWGIPGERDPDDEGSLHLAAFAGDGAILATGRLVWKADGVAQVRSMAVDEAWRGRGLGRQILLRLEEAAHAAGVNTIILHARELAVPFYERCGYHKVELSFLFAGQIQHTLMSRDLRH